MAQQLTVLIPCKNERRNIRLCIESVRGVADEILVADSCSTDGTLQIVDAIGGCRVIERQYVHSADFKNWAIPQSRHEWVLVVDADERLTPRLAEEIRRVLAAPPAEIDGYSIGRLNHYLGHRIKRCGWDTDRVIRLFRRDASRYRQRWVHAEIELDASRVAPLREPMLHYTTWSTDQYVEKLNRYAAWGALNARDEGRRSGTFSLLAVAPLRFLQLYILRLGFLDGVPGFQVCMFAAFYSFLKKAKTWELEHAVVQPDPEAERESEPVLATLTKSGRRAKVEIVRHDGRLAVKKTFKPQHRRFCEREAAALRALNAEIAEAPPVLASGELWLVIPFYDDVLRYKRSSGKLLPLGVAKQAVAALRKVYDAGYAIVDASIDNLLVDSREGLKLFDFEFSHRYEAKPPSFDESYDIVGCPADYAGDLPIQGGNFYDRNWRPYIGLSLASLLNDPAWLQHVKRAVYVATHAHRFLPRLVRHYARAAFSFLRRHDAGVTIQPAADSAPSNADAIDRRAA